MDYKLKTTSENDVEVILPAGSDFVRVSYPEGKCKGIISASKSAKKSDKFPGYIEVNGGEIYIAGTIKGEAEIEPKKSTKKTTNKKA